ncbi:Uncharacterised protein [Clostridioides difficile]|nr:Uncharacterised protein [Clostridioides difficile]
METEIFLLGEQPLHHFVARVTAVDQDRHESVEMLGDAVLVHEQCRNRRVAIVADREQMMVTDECAHSVGRHPETVGDIVDRQELGVGRQSVRRQR